MATMPWSSILDDLPPKDLLAIMREFDSSKESVVNMLVTPEQFAHSIVLEKQYGDRTSERLRAMVNAVIHRDETAVSEYLEAIANVEGGIATLADYFEDHYDEAAQLCHERGVCAGIRAGSRDSGSHRLADGKAGRTRRNPGLRQCHRKRAAAAARSEVADGDWMETAWILRDALPDAFEELMIALRDRMQKHVEALNAALFAASAEAGEPTGDEEESAI